MMKHKRQLFAFLLALCLLASLAVVPAAAATAAELETAAETAKKVWEDAEEAAKAADTALKSAESIIAPAQSAYDQAKEVADRLQGEYDAAKSDADKKQEEYNNAAAENKESIESELAVLRDAETKKKNELDEARETEKSKSEELETAKRDANIDELARKFEGAENAAAKAKKEYEDAKAAADAAKEEENKPETPAVTQPSKSNCGISLSSCDFGQLEKGASSGLSKTVTFSNTSGVPVTVSYSAGRGSGFSISGLPMTVAANSEKSFTLSFASASTTGSYSQSFVITAAYDNGSLDYTITAYAEVMEKGYSLTVDPAAKDLGKLSEGYNEKAAEEKEITVTLENKGAYELRLDGVKGSDHFNVAQKSGDTTLKSGATAKFTVTPKKGMAVGSYTDSIVFQTREGATATLKATVAVEKKLAPLTVEPAEVDFGTVETGYAAIAPRTVTVKNNTEYALRLDQPTSYSYEVMNLTQTSLAAGGSVSFTIRPRTGLPASTYDSSIELWASGETAKLSLKFKVTQPAGPSTFTDVPADSTFAADIAYVGRMGLMGGVGEGRFNPQAPITRGQLVTILYRLEGQPAVSGAGFPDVAAGSYCEKAVKWAAANGITAGGKDGKFKPNDPITREQLATFLYRYNNHKGYPVTNQADLGKFSDAGTAASYSREALSWANGTGLVNGTSDGRLNPSGGATRGQAAAILHRFCVSIGK